MRKSILRGVYGLYGQSGVISGAARLTRRFGFLGGKKKTYYEILDIQANASVKDIKKAFMKKGNFWSSCSQGLPP